MGVTMGRGVLLFFGFALFAFFPFAQGLENPFLFMGASLVFILAFISRKALIMGVVLAANLGIRAYITDPNLPYYIPSFAVGLACYAALIHFLCPRCRLPVGVSWSNWRGIGQRPWCPACGRSRSGVKPFQYLLRPEIWDGEYHDEGGGAQTDAAREATDNARRRWLKQLTKRK